MTRPEQTKTIEDAGEILPYARKHLMPDGATSVTTPKEKSPEKVAQIKLGELWPEPDWVALKGSGVDPHAVATMFMIYSNIRSKPRDSHWGVAKEKWELAYVKSIEVLRMLFKTVRTAEAAEKLATSYEKILLSVGPDFTELPKHINNRYALYSTGKCNSRKKISNAFHLSLKDNLVKTWLVSFGWPENVDVVKYSNFPIELEDGSWRVAHTTRSSYRFRYDKPRTKRQAIDECVQANLEEHPVITVPPTIDAATTHGELQPKEPIYTPKKKKHTTERRHGPEYRKGNISPEILIDTFGFRGIQFGNAMSNVERQEWINNAYDALHDLANVIGFRPKWIGLAPKEANEKALGLAFGARGIGGTNAVAHYEIELNVINLTRASGFGSAAHEWLHGLDARIGKSLGTNDFLTNSFNAANIHNALHRGDLTLGVRTTNQVKAVHKIISACEMRGQFYSQFLTASKTLESQKRAKKYWTKRWELFARSGEAYIQDKLSEHGIYSPWLVNGTLESDCEPDNRSMWPYPAGAERRNLTCCFDLLFAALRR